MSGPDARRQKVVALGGGHGLATNLKALRRLETQVTAVVTVADNGGSSGRLRRELGVLPPGDLRMALTALCSDEEWGTTWARVLQHRFISGGDLHEHAVGNLILVAIWEMVGDHVDGLDWVARLLGAHGRVLPMATIPLDISAVVRGADPARPTELTTVEGQVEVATTPGRVESVSLIPADPPACPAALAAVEDADWIVLGPGSWYTSVLPHLLIPDLRRAICTARGRRVVTLNVAPQRGETDSFAPRTYLEVLTRHAPELAIDVVVADATRVLGHRPGSAEQVDDQTEREAELLAKTAASLGADLVLRDLAASDGSARHDVSRLARAYEGIMR